ncbi:MAG TPA: hypothetical protein VJU82_06440 [Acidobacteriaceae bacterium]|nr:hypothetical protein [Acidobacteriaceae bacterium]
MQSLYWIGFGICLGFGFGVGCALAVMYSIYLGGYRAAVKDFQLDPAPERLTRALAKLARSSGENATR